MNRPTISIRPAALHDLPAIAEVLVDSWRSTFHGILPDAFLSAMSREEQEERHRRRMRQPENIHLVAEDGRGRIVGFANAGRSRSAAFPHSGELYAIYVLEPCQGRGLGRRLVAGTAAAALKHRWSGLLVQALEVNPHRGFYERLGARPLGRQDLPLGDLTVPAVAYGWDDLRSLAARREARPGRALAAAEAGL